MLDSDPHRENSEENSHYKTHNKPYYSNKGVIFVILYSIAWWFFEYTAQIPLNIFGNTPKALYIFWFALCVIGWFICHAIVTRLEKEPKSQSKAVPPIPIAEKKEDPRPISEPQKPTQNISQSIGDGSSNNTQITAIYNGPQPIEFSQEQKSVIASVLKKYPKAMLRIAHGMNNNETRTADNLADFLQEKQLLAWSSGYSGSPALPAGLTIWWFDSDGELAAKEIKESLKPLGIDLVPTRMSKVKIESLTICISSD